MTENHSLNMQFQEATSYINDRMLRELPAHLFYHSVYHVKDVFESATRIARSEGVSDDDLTLLLTAAMYHDCGFIMDAKGHETLSCNIAREHLPAFGYTDKQIELICGMIMATRLPQTPHNLLEQIICDADLDYLGRDDFYTIGDKLFEEFRVAGIVTDKKQWDRLQIGFLENHHYFTPTSIATREQKKLEHLDQLKKTND